MKVNKKIVMICFLVVVVLGLWKGCERLANRELLESITLYELRQESFEKEYETLGRVVCQKEVRVPIEKMVKEVFVNVGDVVKKDEVCIRYVDGSELKSEFEGIVSEVNEAFVSIAILPLWIQVEVPETYIDLLEAEQSVLVKDTKGKITKIGSVASYRDNKNFYDVYISCGGDFRLFEEVKVSMCVQSFHDVYKVPFNAVVRCKQKDYVIKQSWLRDTYELDIDDLVMVDVVGVDDGLVVIRSEDVLQEDVCVFDSLSMEFVQKMLELYV